MSEKSRVDLEVKASPSRLITAFHAKPLLRHKTLAIASIRDIDWSCPRENYMQRLNFTLVLGLLLFLLASGVLFGVPAQTIEDKAAITQTALDYIEGWYEGNAERMERALSPDLAKRIVRTNDKGQSQLQQMTAMGLVQGVKRGGGKDTPADKRQKDVTILDIFGNAAAVKIVASDWIDYLHIAKSNGRWVIINVLWELKPTK